jgi:hypothetical protein
MENLNELLDSKEFNEMFDFETEKKEVEQTGWNYSEMISFGEQLSKLI